MKKLRGQAVSQGIAIGETMILTSHEVKVKESYVTPEKVESEVRRFRRALARTENDIRQLRDQQADEHVDVRSIVSTSLVLLADEHLMGQIETRIRNERMSAPYAVSQTISETADHLKAMANQSFSSKVGDMVDIEHRLLNHLLGGRLETGTQLPRKLIVVADELTPTQAVTLDRDKVLGFATERGSWASHTAILARALGIPAVVGVPGVTTLAALGSLVIIDGNRGCVVIDPDEDVLKSYRAERRRLRGQTQRDRQTKELESVTRDGEPCRIYCNVETKEDIPRVVEYGGAGVGLFRTEFLFLGQLKPPGEDEQYEIYREAVEGMDGRMVTIRSSDFGADKFDRQFGEVGEPNPFMGQRSIRISLKQQDFFLVQLRAILRAAVHGKVRLMFPMVMDLGEFRRAKEVVEKAKAELRDAGRDFDDDLRIGAMIELPSAVLMMDTLAREADFFSVGTNDLTQYTLAVDRTNHRVAALYASHHPAVAIQIGRAVRVARRTGRFLSVCGEMAGDPLYVPLLLGLGVRNFSVAPTLLPAVKRRIRSLNISECLHLAEQARESVDAYEVQQLLLRFQP